MHAFGICNLGLLLKSAHTGRFTFNVARALQTTIATLSHGSQASFQVSPTPQEGLTEIKDPSSAAVVQTTIRTIDMGCLFHQHLVGITEA